MVVRWARADEAKSSAETNGNGEKAFMMPARVD
jgi:hypothetical protein